MENHPNNLSASPQPGAMMPRSPGAAVAVPAAPPPPAGLNVAVLIRRGLAHWYIAVLIAIVGLGITFQVVRHRKLTYRSETVIFYREGIQRGLIGEGGPDPLKHLGAKLKEMLLSQTTLKVVIDDCHIYQDQVQKKGYNDAVEGLRKKIDFKSRTADTFAITYDGSSREEAQEVTAKLAEMLIESTTRSRESQAKSATEFLDAEKKRLDEELDASDKAVAKFVSDHPEYALEASTRPGAGVRADAKKGADAAKTSMRADRIAQQTAPGVGGPLPKKGSGQTSSPSPSPADVDPELLASKKTAQAELAKAQREFDDLSQKYTPEWPDVQSAAKRRDAAAAQLAQIEAKIVAATPPPPPPPPPPTSPDDPYSEGTARGGPLPLKPPAGSKDADTKKDKEKSKSQQMVEVEAEWQRLSRESEAARQRVADIDAKRFRADMQASATMSGDVGQIAVLDPAYKPNGPVTMPNQVVAMMGAVASLAVGLALAAARGILLDDRIYDPSEIEGLELGPVLAVVPKVKKRGARWRRG